ncbi:unnamed protein product [Microthlaspi erraticum]|uniref:Uncharacterized protein n=1 Tax=Microthlaspi erraticum TaxID=1685480 RepID=A0A6D2JJX2_9BRAS|nr:unnamed protein product [Microthlaspi erraticum]
MLSWKAIELVLSNQCYDLRLDLIVIPCRKWWMDRVSIRFARRQSPDREERDGKEMYMMRKNEMRMNETVQNGTRRKREGINRTGHNEAKIIPDKAERDGKKGMGQYETGKNRTRRNGEGNRTGRNEMGNRTG